MIAKDTHELNYPLPPSKKAYRQELDARRTDLLKQWKMSSINAVAQRHRLDHSRTRNEMFTRTHTTTPWTVVRADDKKLARLNVIKALLTRLDYADKDHDLTHPDPAVVFGYAETCIVNRMIAP